MEPRNYLTALLRGWVIILVAGLLGALAAWAFTATRTDTYEAQSSGIVAVENVESGSDLWQTANATIAMASSYADLISTPLVTEPAAEAVGGITAGELAQQVTATVPLDSVNITIEATDTDPARAAEIANAAVHSLQSAVTEVAPTDSAGEPAVELVITQEATAPTSPGGLPASLLIAIGLVAGLGIGALIALLRAPVRPMTEESVRTESPGSATTPAAGAHAEQTRTVETTGRPTDTHAVRTTDTRATRTDRA